jgi:hypothetical protein
MIPVAGVPNTDEPKATNEWETSTHEDENANNEKIGWGTKHPCYGRDIKRARWSEDELRIVKFKVDTIVSKNNGEVPFNLNVLVLEDVRGDPNAKQYFLDKHVESNLAIRNGIRQICRM